MAQARRRGTALLLAAGAVVTAACSAGPPPSSVPEPDIVGAWELADGTTGGMPIPRPAGGRATLTVERDILGGTAFCNSYGGGYRLRGDRIELHHAGGTEMACEPELMAAEQP